MVITSITRYYGEADPYPQPGWVLFPVSGKWRGVREDVWEKLIGPKPPQGFPHDGCTRVPDGIRDVRWWPACSIHDWHYSDQGPDISRLAADWKLARNLYKISRIQGWSRRKALGLAFTYGKGVLFLGHFHFKRA